MQCYALCGEWRQFQAKFFLCEMKPMITGCGSVFLTGKEEQAAGQPFPRVP